jgi:hypothetical protein
VTDNKDGCRVRIAPGFNGFGRFHLFPNFFAFASAGAITMLPVVVARADARIAGIVPLDYTFLSGFRKNDIGQQKKHSDRLRVFLRAFDLSSPSWLCQNFIFSYNFLST